MRTWNSSAHRNSACVPFVVKVACLARGAFASTVRFKSLDGITATTALDLEIKLSWPYRRLLLVISISNYSSIISIVQRTTLRYVFA